MIKINPSPENPYPVICSWCRRVCGYTKTKNSHGICQNCADKILTEWRQETVAKETLHYGEEALKWPDLTNQVKVVEASAYSSMAKALR